MMNLFRKVENEYRLTKKKLSSLTETDAFQLEVQKLELLAKMVAYINSYAFLSHAKYKEKIKAFLNNNYQYKVVAKQLGISVNSLQASVSYASKQLEKKIGTAFLLLQSDDIPMAERAFVMDTGQGTNPMHLLLEGVVKQLPEPQKDNSVQLKECVRELKFLSSFTKSHIHELIQTLQSNKLKHLLYMLTNSDPVYVERDVLIRFLNGDLRVEEVLELL